MPSSAGFVAVLSRSLVDSKIDWSIPTKLPSQDDGWFNNEGRDNKQLCDFFKPTIFTVSVFLITDVNSWNCLIEDFAFYLLKSV